MQAGILRVKLKADAIEPLALALQCSPRPP